MKSKILELANLRKKQGKQVVLSPDHPLPVTRREFLAAGLRDSAIFISIPTILDLLMANRALGAEVQPSTVFVCFDSAGGAGHQQREYLPVTSSGSLPAAAALQKMGISSGVQTTTKYGAPMAAAGRVVTELTKAPPTGGVVFAPPPGSSTPSKIQFASFSMTTRDDTSDNRHANGGLIGSYLAMVSQANYYVQSGMNVGGGGNRSTVGGNSGGPISGLKTLPWLSVSSANSIRDAVSFPGIHIRGNLAVSSLTSAERMANRRRDGMGGGNASREKAQEVSDGMTANLGNARDGQNLALNPADAFPQGLHPSTNTILSGGNLSGGELAGFSNSLLAMVRGISRPLLTVVLGGGDYHTGNETAETAFVLRKYTMVRALNNECLLRGITVVASYITDGGMNAGGGGQAFTSDEGRFSRQIISVTNPNGPITPVKSQIGFSNATTGFTEVAGSLIAENNPLAAAVMFGSMLKAAGEPNWLQIVRRVVPADVLSGVSDADLARYNAFV